MAINLAAPDWLREKTSRVVLDVRSPGEFAQGHVPGAVSFPLFSDDERARVGTVYKQQGKEPALQLGLQIVGPKMADFVETARVLAPERRLAVHCWRGGQRSRSMGWLLGMAGFDVALLEGGYKFYRRHVLEGFEKMSLKIIVVGGQTGTGKTKILHALRRAGEQVIDLEAIAHHKGSAFGSIGELAQPTVEQFENDLFEAVCAVPDPARRVWVENESRKIGCCIVPEGFWNKMKAAPLFNIEVPFEARVQNLLDDYARYPVAELEAAFEKIGRRLGGQHLKAALESLRAGDFAAAAEVALWYYDKTYQFCLENNSSPHIRLLKFDEAEPGKIARTCIELAENEF